MMWGCMTFSGVGDACWLKEGIDSSTYVDVLDDYVLASFHWNSMDAATSIFQHDNARVHTARIVKEFLTNNGITTIDWPVNSPDLSPIENLWGYIKWKLDQYTEAPETQEELWGRVESIWTEIPLDFIQHVYESMPSRMEKVLKSKGGPIDY